MSMSISTRASQPLSKTICDVHCDFGSEPMISSVMPITQRPDLWHHAHIESLKKDWLWFSAISDLNAPADKLSCWSHDCFRVWPCKCKTICAVLWSLFLQLVRSNSLSRSRPGSSPTQSASRNWQSLSQVCFETEIIIIAWLCHCIIVPVDCRIASTFEFICLAFPLGKRISLVLVEYPGPSNPTHWSKTIKHDERRNLKRSSF
jgi:hypothetical protein